MFRPPPAMFARVFLSLPLETIHLSTNKIFHVTKYTVSYYIASRFITVRMSIE
jgi:hypothetical protein